MLKKLSLLLVFVLLLTSMPIMAAEEPVVYTSTITVTEDGGRYQIGFINVEFKKDSLYAENLPITFEVKVYAENGVPYIEFSPDVADFYKNVHIRIDKYNGLLFDQATGENIQINVKKQQIIAEHFSRYAF